MQRESKISDTFLVSCSLVHGIFVADKLLGLPGVYPSLPFNA